MKRTAISTRLCEQGLLYGVDSLSDSELLSVSTGLDQGLVQSILIQYPLNKLEDLMDTLPLDPRQKLQLEALFQIIQRIGRAQYQRGVTIKTPVDVANLFMSELQHQKIEVVMVAFLNVRNQLIRVDSLATGTVSSAIISPREIARVALRHNAAAVIVAHCHPSGETSPSQDDIKATKCLAEALDLLSISLLDHLIIGGSNFLSMKQTGAYCERSYK